MQKHRAHRNTFIFMATMAFMVGLAVLMLPAERGFAVQSDKPYEHRMAVDPTVLPPVMPPEAPLDAESVATPIPTDTMEEENEPDVVVEPIKSVSESEPEPAATVEVAPPVAVPSVAPKPESTVEKTATPTPKGKGEVRKITAAYSGKQLILTVFCDRPVGDTSYMNLKNPRRVVVDLRQPWVHNARNVIRLKKGPVKYIITGDHPDRFRMVVHFRKPPRSGMTPKMTRTGNKLIVSIPLP